MHTATPAPTKPRIDRRLDERQDCLLGLSRWLESARKQLGVGAIALASRDGCLVAGAGSAQKCEELAALAPLVPENRNGHGTPTIIPLVEGEAWLCAQELTDNPALWGNVRSGCLRILGLSLAA